MEKVICYSFCFFVEAIILWLYSSCLFISKHKLHIRFLLLCCLYLILFTVSLFDIKWLNAILYLFANFIFLVTQFQTKWYSAFFHSTLLAAIMGMCELLVYSIVELFTPHFFAEVESFHNTIIFAIFSKITFFTIIYILAHLLKRQQKNSHQYSKSSFLLLFIPVTSVLIMLTFVGIIDTSILPSTLNQMIILSSVFLLAINLLIFGINQYMEKKNQEYTEMQLLLQKEADFAEYYKVLLKQSENQSILIHDIKKHLQSIDLLNQQKEYNKISAYIQQLMLSSDLKEVNKMCDHDLLNAVLSRYKRQCDSNHIAFFVDIRSKTTNFIDDNDLTSLFCNLLDNAVEASEKIPDAFIELNVRKQEQTPYIVITIINSCRSNPFSNQNGSLVTTKPEKGKHGFGLKSIRKTVNKYQGDMMQYYDDETATFHTVITLKQ